MTVKTAQRRAFTLIEVILASLLAAVVLFIVATSIQVQMRAFNAGRAQVERAQLARVLLHRMADDIRGLLPPRAEIESTGSGSSTSTQESDGEKKADGKTETDAAQNEQSADKSASDASDGSQESDDSSQETDPQPGVHGGTDWLRIDVVHSARWTASASDDQSAADGSASQSAAQIETIIYYAKEAEETLSATVPANSPESGGGLMRRQFVRPAAELAVEYGQLDYLDGSGTPIAPEVASVEFRYYDGTDWLEEWDTTESGSLPRAIEIRLFLRVQTNEQTPDSQTSSGQTVDDAAGGEETQYRLVVPIELNVAGQAAPAEITDQSGESDAAQDQSGKESTSNADGKKTAEGE